MTEPSLSTPPAPPKRTIKAKWINLMGDYWLSLHWGKRYFCLELLHGDAAR